MNNKQRFQMLENVAKESLKEAEFSFKNKVWNLVVRRCQEAVELGLNSILAFAGIDFPKNHDKGPMVMNVLRANSIDLDGKEKEVELISLDLSRKRGPALHQEEGYEEDTALKAIEDTKVVFAFIEKAKTELEKIK